RRLLQLYGYSPAKYQAMQSPSVLGHLSKLPCTNWIVIGFHNCLFYRLQWNCYVIGVLQTCARAVVHDRPDDPAQEEVPPDVAIHGTIHFGLECLVALFF